MHHLKGSIYTQRVESHGRMERQSTWLAILGGQWLAILGGQCMGEVL